MMWGVGYQQKGAPSGGGGKVEEVKPTMCSHRGDDGTGRPAGGNPGSGGGESSVPSRASSRKPESQEGPHGQESGWEHRSHGKGTGQGGLFVSPPPPAGPAPALGSLWPERPWERAPTAPRRGCGDRGAGEGRSEPPVCEGKQ